MAVNWRQVAYQSAVNAGHPDPDMFVRQMLAESGLRPNAISPAGATGIAQIMPATAKGWGVDPNDPYAALGAAAKAMTKYMRSYNGNAAMALAAYNAGPGAVAQYRGVPPYEETKAYIAKIMGGGKTGLTSQGPTGGTVSQQVPQGPGANPVAVSNQINRIGYAYGNHGVLAQPHIDKLTKSLTGASGALTNPTMEPGGVASTEGPAANGYFRTPNGLVQNRRAGEAAYQFYQRLGQKGFGLRNDAGDHQTTGGSHAQNSWHYRQGGVDFGNGLNSEQSLQTFYDWLKPRQQSVGYQELLQEDPGTSNYHVHIGGEGPSTNAIRPTNSRRRPVRKNRAPK